MKKWKKIWAYGSVAALWFVSQLGLVDAPCVEAKNIQPNDQNLKVFGREPIYLEKTSTIQNSLEDIFSNDNLDQLAHYSHSSHSSHQSHSSHYSHYSGTGDDNNGSDDGAYYGTH